MIHQFYKSSIGKIISEDADLIWEQTEPVAYDVDTTVSIPVSVSFVDIQETIARALTETTDS